MPLQLAIADRIVVHAHGCPPETFAALRAWALERFCFDNPAYWQAREHRRACKHIPRRIELAQADDERIVLPRGANLELKRFLAEHAPDLAIVLDDQRVSPPLGPFALSFELRPYQQEAVDRVALQREGVIVAPTGTGKTVIALGIIARLGVRALVLVHTRTLLDQTCAVLEKGLGVRPGRIGGGKDEPGPVIVATLQSLMRRDPKELRDAFGLVILDEAHHCPAATFTDVVQRFTARYRVGLTATPERADELHPLMYATLGPELCRVQPGQMVDEGSLWAPQIIPVETEFRGGRMVNRGAMIHRLCGNETRNAAIAATVSATRGERSLVLSERVQHCEDLAARLTHAGVDTLLLVGTVAAPERELVLQALRSRQGAVLVATTSLLGEGFDLPVLDTLYLATPSGNTTRTTQAIGRVLRPSPGKAKPRVYDFVDVHTPGLVRAFRSRLSVYRLHHAEIRLPWSPPAP